MRGSRSIALVLILSIGSLSTGAFADPKPSELAAARNLFEQGLKLEDKKDWAGALVLFRKVAAVKVTPAVRFHVALCLEKTGKLVDALNEFTQAQTLGIADGTPDAQLVATNSGKHIAELRARIPTVRIEVPADVSEPTVMIDESTVGASLLGTAIPIDPGKHTIEVRASGRETFRTNIEVSERDEKKVTAVMPVSNEAPKKKTPIELPPPSREGRGPAPWIAAGVGVAAFIGAGVFYAMRSSAMRDLDGACDETRGNCPPDKLSVYDRGRTYTTAGNVFTVVGGVAVATSIVLFIALPTGSKSTQVGLSPTSITLRAVF